MLTTEQAYNKVKEFNKVIGTSVDVAEIYVLLMARKMLLKLVQSYKSGQTDKHEVLHYIDTLPLC